MVNRTGPHCIIFKVYKYLCYVALRTTRVAGRRTLDRHLGNDLGGRGDAGGAGCLKVSWTPDATRFPRLHSIMSGKLVGYYGSFFLLNKGLLKC